MISSMDNLARHAIQAALAANWQEALKTNLSILRDEPEDIDALNRAAKACVQLGKIEEALSFSKKVLSIDPLNSIAEKCITKCSLFQSSYNEKIINRNHKIYDVFLEIPGKTKIVSLVNICESTVLASIDAGDSVLLIPKMHKVSVTTHEEVYIGRLPDDLATRIIYFTKHGNEYEAYIKSIVGSDVKVFIKEIKRSETLNNTPSFPIRY